MSQQITRRTSRNVLTNDSRSMVQNEAKEEENIICAICQTAATDQTVFRYRYCRDCPTIQNHRIYYCDRDLCTTMIDMRHTNNPNLNHRANLKNLGQEARTMVVRGQYTLRNTYNSMVETFRRNQILMGVAKKRHAIVTLGTHTLSQVIHFSTSIASGVDITTAFDSLSSSAGLGTLGIVNSVMFGIETCCYVAKWFNGEISGRDLAVKVGRSAATNASGCVGAWAGGKTGAVIGGMIGGPVGALFGGIIGMFAGNWVARKLSGKIYDKYIPEDDEKARREAFSNALEFFHFEPQDVNNPQIFNETSIRRYFRRHSLRWHPDRNGGSNERFIALTNHYAVLLAHLDKKNNNNRNRERINRNRNNNPLSIQL